MKPLLRLFICFVVIAAIAGCSSSSTTSIPNENSPTTNAPNGTQAISALPTVDDQPNTVSPSLQIDTSGRQHSVYSNIDGQVIYATCTSQCTISSQWNTVVVLSASIDPILGYAVPKLQIDQNGTLHMAVVVNLEGGVVFATQQSHYFQCQSNCLSANSWVGEVVHVHSDGHLQEDLNNTHWFDLSSQGNPKFAFIESTPGLFGDDFLYIIDCNQNCTDAGNWQTRPITELNLASKMPVTIRTTASGGVHLLYEYHVIASTGSELQYTECVSNCDSVNSVWSTPISIQSLNRETFNYNTHAADLIADTAPFVAILSNTDGVVDVKTATCVEQCSQVGNWVSASILSNINLPANTTISGRSIDVNFDRGSLDIALTAKLNSVSVATSLARVSCTTDCFAGAWSYEEIASSAPIVFDDIGNCTFIATRISGPIRLTPDATSAVLVPHWACNGSPIEVTDANGNVFIDYNGDIRFFEVAAVAQNL